ncbi:MAG: DUF4350 domain-containing protein [Pseudomonadota bacterium]
MSRGNLIVGLVLAVATGLLLYWFFTNFERRQETIDTGYSAEARRNPMLAAGRMLRQLGVDAQPLEPGAWEQHLTEGRGTVFVLSRSWTLGEEELEQLLDWVRSGGHVVVAPVTVPKSLFGLLPDDLDDQEFDDDEAESEDDDAPQSSAGVLLDAFGLEVIDLGFDILSEVRGKSITANARRLPTGIRDIDVRFPTRTRLVSQNSAVRVVARDKHGVCAYEGSYGRGRFTALCTLRSFTNRWIDEAENATFLWHVVHNQDPGAPVWFLFDTDMPPLHRWFWEHAPETVTVFGLLLLAWFWAALRRSGPMRDLSAPGNRRTLEHVEASGRFVFRREGAEPLLSAMRRDVLARLSRRHPAIARQADAERYQQLAVRAALSPEQVFRALTSKPRSRAGFIEAVRHLQRLKESL